MNDRGKNPDGMFLNQTIHVMQEIFKKHRKKMTPELYSKIMKSIDSYERKLQTIHAMQEIFKKNGKKIMNGFSSYERQFADKGYDAIFCDRNFIIQRIFAAVLLWRYGECTPKILYNSFKIHYEQMRRMTEIISYRLDMIRFSSDIAPGKKSDAYSSLRKEIGLERLNEVKEKFEKISSDMMYQPSNELCDLLGIRHCDMHQIRQLKSVETAYNKLMKFSADEKMPEDYIQKLIRKINCWPANWREKFIGKFGGIFNEQR